MNPLGMFLSWETVFQEKTFQLLEQEFRQGSTFLKRFSQKYLLPIPFIQNVSGKFCDRIFASNQNRLCWNVSCWKDVSVALFHLTPSSWTTNLDTWSYFPYSTFQFSNQVILFKTWMEVITTRPQGGWAYSIGNVLTSFQHTPPQVKHLRLFPNMFQ